MIFNNNNKIVSLKNNSSYVSTLSDATGTIFNSIKYTKTFYKGFSFHSNIDIESLPAGRYFFECVGGGVNNGSVRFNDNAYIWCECLFTTETIIYICCGGPSVPALLTKTYNGGGMGKSNNIAINTSDNGAGATHISLSYGLLNDGVVRNNLICAAGGVGGMSGQRLTTPYTAIYSNGGGETGQLTSYHKLYMVGTQIEGGGTVANDTRTGYAGTGGNGIRFLSYNAFGGGGGGGWYGGKGGEDDNSSSIKVSGGGGSGKIGSVSQVIKGGMIAKGEEGYVAISNNGYDSQVNIYTLTPQI